jgi:hypothetical protein
MIACSGLRAPPEWRFWAVVVIDVIRKRADSRRMELDIFDKVIMAIQKG